MRIGLEVANAYIVANSTVLSIGSNVVINATSIFAGNSTINSISGQTTLIFANSTVTTTFGTGGADVGANVQINTTGMFIGNSTINTTGNVSVESFSNSTITSVYGRAGANVGANVQITTTGMFIGNSTANTTGTVTTESFSNSTITSVYGLAGANVGANVQLSSSSLLFGNSTVNTSIQSTGVKFADGNTQNTAAFGKTMVWIPAGAMKARTTAGATSNTYESTTNFVNFDVFDFSATVNNFTQFSMNMPKAWNGSTVTAQFMWLQPATTTNFGTVWSLSGVGFANTSPSDTAQGTAVLVTSTGAVNNAIYVSPETAAITIGGNVSSQSLVNFEVKRVATDAGDTMAVIAKLLGVRLYYTSNTTNDV